MPVLDNVTINQPVADLTALAAIPTANLVAGCNVFVVSKKCFYYWTGSAWTQGTKGIDSFRIVTSNTTAAWGEFLLVDTSAGDVVITFTTAVGHSQEVVYIQKTTDVNQISFVGGTWYDPLFLNAPDSMYAFISDGTNIRLYSSWEFQSKTYVATSTPPSGSNDYTQGYSQGSFGLVRTSPVPQLWWCETGGAFGGDAEWIRIGNVVGPASSTTNEMPYFSDTTGKVLGHAVGTQLNSIGEMSVTSLALPNSSASQLVATDASKKLQTLTTATYPSLTEVAYVKGVTSAIQTQLDAKPSLASANTFTKAQSVTPVALTSTSNSIATDASLSNIFTHTLTENTTLANPTNLVTGTYYTWKFTQASSAKTLAFGNKFKWPGGTALTISTGNGAVDIITGLYDGTNINTVISGQAFA